MGAELRLGCAIVESNTHIDPFDNTDYEGHGKYGTNENLDGPAVIETGASNTYIDPFNNTDYEGHGKYGTNDNPLPDHSITQQYGALPNPNPTGFLDTVKSGLIRSSEDRMRFFASKRFPNDQDAWQRYDEIGGEIAFKGDDGQWYKEQESDASLNIGDATRWLGEAAGSSGLPVAGAIVGTATGGFPGALLGATSGEAYRQLGARALGYADKPPPGVSHEQHAMDNMAQEAAFESLGYGAGAAASKFASGRQMISDAGKFDQAAADSLQAKAAKYGMTLTPAEITGLRSLINEETALGMGQDDVADALFEFLASRNLPAGEAIEKFTGNVPRADTVGQGIRSVAEGVIDDAGVARSTATKTGYRLNTGPNAIVPEEAIGPLMEDDMIRSMYDQVNIDPGYGVMDQAPNSMQVMDAVYKLLGDKMGAAKRAGEDNRLRMLGQAQTKVGSVMDQAYPGYKDVRGTYASFSKYLNSLKEGHEGRVAKTPDTSLEGLADSLFKGKNARPEIVADTRKQFLNQGKEKEWNDAVNLYLKDAWRGTATKDVQAGENINSPANFRKAIFGAKEQRDVMREALGPERFKSFSDLMDVFAATGRVARGQSMTVSGLAAEKETKRRVAPLRSAAKDAMRFDWFGWWIDADVAKQKKAMVKIMTSPDAMNKLDDLGRLRGLTPYADKKYKIVAQLFESATYAPWSQEEKQAEQGDR